MSTDDVTAYCPNCGQYYYIAQGHCCPNYNPTGWWLPTQYPSYTFTLPLDVIPKLDLIIELLEKIVKKVGA